MEDWFALLYKHKESSYCLMAPFSCNISDVVIKCSYIGIVSIFIQEEWYMQLEWMGKNRGFVEKLIRYANLYASIYKKEDYYGTKIPISFAQVQVLEYLLENEELNQNMSMIATRLGITPSNFTKIVNKLVKKGLLQKFYIEGNLKNVVIRVTKEGKELYEDYSKYIYEISFSKMFKEMEDVPEEYMNTFAKGMEAAIWLNKESQTIPEVHMIPVKSKGKNK